MPYIITTPDGSRTVRTIGEMRNVIVTEVITRRRDLSAWNAVGDVGRAGHGVVHLADGGRVTVTRA